MLTTQDQQKLLRLAASKAIHSPGKAYGQCLMTTLELACAARDIEGLSLLRWQVTKDPDFHEHWALRFSVDDALDPTRIQVDGKRAVVKAIASYPANYFLGGEYPLNVFLKSPDAGAQERRILKEPGALRWSIHRHDVASAAGVKKAGMLFVGLFRFAHFLINVKIGESGRRMEARRQKLRQRLATASLGDKKGTGKATGKTASANRR